MANFFNLFPSKDNNQDSLQKSSVDLTEQEKDKAIRKAIFIDELGDTKSRKTDKLAVSTITPDFLKDQDGNSTSMAIWMNDSFKQMTDFHMDHRKFERICDYRELAEEEKIEGCIHEIAINCLPSTFEKEPISVELKGDYSDKIKEIINKELARVVELFELDKDGQEYFSEFLTTGELAFENVFSLEKPEWGIIDIKAIPPENIDPVYRNFYNKEIETFLLRKPNDVEINHPNNIFNLQNQRHRQQAVTSFTTVPMARSQVTYCNSGKWDRNGQFVIPYIMMGQKAQKKLTLIEDAIVINAMVNAPERLLWNIPTGSMDGPTQERYMNNIIQHHKKNKGADRNGNITERFNPMGITEDFYIPVKADGQSASVTRLAGSSAFGSGFDGMLDYFHQKVYESLKVPVARLNPDASQSDGTTITMQELAFAERIEALQKRFAYAIKQTLITHLKMKGLKLHNESCQNSLVVESRKNGIDVTHVAATEKRLLEEHIKLVQEDYHYGVLAVSMQEQGCQMKEVESLLGRSYWNQFDLKDADLKVKFNLPTSFMALREQQIRSIQQENFNALVSNDKFSFWWLAKRELKMTDADVLANHDWNKREAAYLWELSQIEQAGPEFRKQAAIDAGLVGDEAGGLGGGGGAGGSALPSGLGGGGEVGDFGDAGGALDDLGDSPDAGGEPSEFGDSPAPTNDSPEPEEKPTP